ncbi:Cell division protein FtsI [Peptidoglycan synthetase] [uncultured Synechococcales cyanobacterium]|uniref:Cell division protein FtsI [Peptidoglycan synthetase] n=1 Tax=uncultured Synechococcales cyanobacterium TaxID=1936017 RepID=A0A6J4UKJ8_9CYAN|nr:Cell division protein FtsI [Peptidoglycan synthetase] [uncultured Synechococcales cyanobacterium]
MATTTSRRSEATTTATKTRPQGTTLRLLLVWVVLIFGELGLAARLVYLHVVEAPVLLAKARAQQLTPLRPFSARRPIVDRLNNILAIDESVYTLYVHPYLFNQPAEVVATQLAPIVKRSVSDLTQLFKTAESGIPVAYELSEQVVDQIKGLQLEGLDLSQERQRLYPQADLTSNLVGYVNGDHEGQAGLEYSLQKQLEPVARSAKVSFDGQGVLLPDRVPLNLIRADDQKLRLTLDTRLQRAARAALKKQLNHYRALRGTVIVMDVQDGSLLALVSEPSYDPKRYYQADPELYKNWALSDLYEPGSTFKPINVAIALETGRVQPDNVFYDEGKIAVGGWPIQNNDYAYAGSRGPLSISKILEYSSNVGMVHIMQQVKPAVYYDWLARLGIGHKVGSDLPFETAGQFKPKAQFTSYPIEPATTAFGQGFSMTPLQMTQLHALLANGGKLVTPHVVQGVFNSAGEATWKPDLPVRQVLAPTTTQAVVSMMGNVVSRGTGKPAQIPGYRLGGKTGTAQKAVGGQYSSARITSFVGIFPLEAPRYVVLSVVDEPKGDDAYGSTVAAPVVKSVIETLITLEGIPPSHPAEVHPQPKKQ